VRFARNDSTGVSHRSLRNASPAPSASAEKSGAVSCVHPTGIESKFWNCGQVCTCNERTYVQRDVYEEFAERFVEAASSLRMGDPTREDVQMGPKVNEPELEKVEAIVRGAVEGGAEIVLGGGRPEGDEFAQGYWFEPTVLTGTTNDMEIVQNEVFGPVLPIQRFDEFEEVVNFANYSRYCLSAYVFTSDPSSCRASTLATGSLEWAATTARMATSGICAARPSTSTTGTSVLRRNSAPRKRRAWRNEHLPC
jgi:acyl-CoA reductase-like NAD-dependent aldehyde dehydrogenase